MEQPGPGGSRTHEQLPNDDWDDRLAKIDWSQFHTAYGEASPVRLQLGRLRSKDEAEALAAAHDLWCGLCHQHVQNGSAALPALPFLLEAFATADDRLKTELLDIFLGLAITSNQRRIEDFHVAMGQATPCRPQWMDDVRSGLEAALPSILPLRNHADPDIADFARTIAAELASTNVSIQEKLSLEQPLMPDFQAASAEFTKFLVQQGYPPNRLWVTPADVVVHKWNGAWTWFVWKGDPTEREQRARKEFQAAISRGIGLALKAHAKTDQWAICHVCVPVDESQAERLMIPQTGVKYSVVNNPPPAVLVERKWWWSVLNWLARKSPSGRHPFLEMRE